VRLTSAGLGLGGVAFSLDYDATCLDPDTNDDGVLDLVTNNPPGDFSVTILFDESDSDGEIDISIYDMSPPVAALPEGEMLAIQLMPTCAPALQTTVVAPVLFSLDPSPSFSDQAANDVSGSWFEGAVEIYPGPRGDCNSTDTITIADLIAEGLEIFDGDDSGSDWIRAVDPTYIGSPVGCDANANQVVDVADILETNDIMFGITAPETASEGNAAPQLLVGGAFAEAPGELIWLRCNLDMHGWQVAGVAFSIELDPAHFELATLDADGDGVPDQVRYPNGEPGMANLRFDADGKLLKVLLADLSRRALGDGTVLEIGVVAGRAGNLDRGLSLGSQPRPSFGLVGGDAVDGMVALPLFSDGFESGTTGQWSKSFQ
jgi:hypothetical protein